MHHQSDWTRIPFLHIERFIVKTFEINVYAIAHIDTILKRAAYRSRAAGIGSPDASVRDAR